MDEQPNNSLLKAGLVLALAVASFFGFLYFKEKQSNDNKSIELTKKANEVFLTNAKFDSLSREFDLKIAELMAMGEKVDELEQAKSRLEIDRQRLRNSQSTDMRAFNQKLKQYEDLITRKDKELQILREENLNLADQNVNLTDQNTELHTSNTRLKQTTESLTDSVSHYSAVNKDLKEKVTIAAALRPVRYSVIAINKRGKEREGDEFKSRRVDRVKLTFNLDYNPLTKKENKTIYMRLLEPTGNVISDMALGSGVFLFGGKETVYSTKQNINYTDNFQPVEFIYDHNQKFVKGDYKIELYADGFRIGQTNFTIK